MSGGGKGKERTLFPFTQSKTHTNKEVKSLLVTNMILHLWVVQVFDVLWHHSLAFNSTQLCCVSFIVMTINFGIFSIFHPWPWYSVVKLNLYYSTSVFSNKRLLCVDQLNCSCSGVFYRGHKCRKQLCWVPKRQNKAKSEDFNKIIKPVINP